MSAPTITAFGASLAEIIASAPCCVIVSCVYRRTRHGRRAIAVLRPLHPGFCDACPTIAARLA